MLGPALAFGFVALMFACIALLRVPLVWMLGGLGVVAFALAWRRLKP